MLLYPHILVVVILKPLLQSRLGASQLNGICRQPVIHTNSLVSNLDIELKLIRSDD